MKFNKWTLGLAAVGLVSLNYAAMAEDTSSTVLTALSSTTLSGYVDTSAQWNLGTGNANNPPYSFNSPDKADGFNLNVVQLSLDRPMDESEWAAGYHVDLWMGPDANLLGSQSSGIGADFAIRQAYIALRTPIGNGIDWKVGVFDTIIGYESLTSANNPNYSRSYGFTIEPTTHTGIVGTYRLSDLASVTAGVANTVGPVINNRAFGGFGPADGTQAESYKTYMASTALTAPSSWGWIGGSTLSVGIINGFNSSVAPTAVGAVAANQLNFYAGATMNTPISALKVGASYDLRDVHNAEGDAWNLAGYVSYQATEKLSFNGRGEYFDLVNAAHVFEATATAQYDLWKNVVTRLEFRWDHGSNGRFFGGEVAGDPNRRNAYMLAAQAIYKF